MMPKQDLNLSQKEWLEKIRYRGLEHKSEEQLADLESYYPQKIEESRFRLFMLEAIEPTQKTITEAESKLANLRSLREQKKFKFIVAVDRETKDALAQGIEQINLQIISLQELIDRPEEIQHLKDEIDRLEEKFAVVLKERKFRAQGVVKRIPLGTIYYIDFNNGADLTLDYTFTNGSSTVNVSGDPGATDGIEVGDYIRVKTGGVQWYKVTAVNDTLDTITIWPTFQQANTGAVSAILNDVSAKDGTTTANAWTHINRATTDTVRSAGDIIKVRANQTHTYKGIDITFDEEASPPSNIQIRACTSSDDPWGDGSDVKPIITFGDTSNQIFISKNQWILKAFDLKESDDSFGALYLNAARGTSIEDFDIHDNGNNGLYGSGAEARIKNCNFYNNISHNLEGRYSMLFISDCTFNGGAVTTDYGLYATSGCILFIKDSSFGQTTAHDLNDIFVSMTSTLTMRNVKYNSIAAYCPQDVSVFIRSEDDQQVKGANKASYFEGTVTKDTGVTRAGGASSSAKVEPNSSCGSLTLANEFLQGDFQIWCPASPTTVTVYIRSLGAWATYPTASELYITAEYWDGANAKRVESPHSTQVLTDETTWVAFTTTFTPSAAGWVYVKVYLKKYEANKGIYVDVKPVTS